MKTSTVIYTSAGAGTCTRLFYPRLVVIPICPTLTREIFPFNSEKSFFFFFPFLKELAFSNQKTFNDKIPEQL